MVNFQTRQENEKLTTNTDNNNPSSLTVPIPNSGGDLEAARSPSNGLVLPAIIAPHRADSIPASVTSLPVQGIEPAPTHRRRRNRRRRGHHQGLNAVETGDHFSPPNNSMAIAPLPRRANSLPVNPASRNAEGLPAGQPFDWLKNLDTLLVPTKKIVQKPNLTQCFGKGFCRWVEHITLVTDPPLVNTAKYSWLNVMLVLLPVAWAVVSILALGMKGGTCLTFFSIYSTFPISQTPSFSCSRSFLSFPWRHCSALPQRSSVSAKCPKMAS